MTDPAAVAERLKPYAKSSGKPVLTSWMGGASIAPGEAILNAAGIPTFPYPDTAARAFTYMWRYSYNLRGTLRDSGAGRRRRARSATLDARRGTIIATARSQGARAAERSSNPNRFCRTTAFLRSRPGSPAAKTKQSSCARALGYPVVLKIFSETITHKTDVGGVKLNLQDETAVRSAFQAIKASVARRSVRINSLALPCSPWCASKAMN